MCTSISLTNPVLFGRNLDLEYSFGQQVVITPRNHPFSFHHHPPLASHLAMIGMATVAQDTPLYAEAVNEKGLYMAGLNFPGNACYTPQPSAKTWHLAPYELIPMILGTCETLAQARALLENTELSAIPFGPGYPLAPLHWHLADATGAITVEPMEQGLVFYENPVGVLTNNPPFSYHMLNLRNYQALSPAQPENRLAPNVDLPPYGQGMGALGLPGDWSPASRFVRAAFLRCTARFGPDKPEQIVQFFHLLQAVSMVRGSVRTPEGNWDETQYSCCIDPQTGTYYYQTYDAGHIVSVDLFSQDLDRADLYRFSLVTAPRFFPADPDPRPEPGNPHHPGPDSDKPHHPKPDPDKLPRPCPEPGTPHHPKPEPGLSSPHAPGTVPHSPI